MLTILVWRHPRSSDIINSLVSNTNPNVTIANSKIDLSTLLLHEATLLSETSKAAEEATLQVVQFPNLLLEYEGGLHHQPGG